MKHTKRIVTTALFSGALAFGVLAPINVPMAWAEETGDTATTEAESATPAAAAKTSPKDAVSSGVKGAGGGQPNQGALNKAIKNIVNVLLYILGAVAVIMIVVGGIKYTTSNGDSSAVTSAKNTILYAVIGLVIAIMAFAIVNFVISAF